ncbi:KH 1 domain containing protein [Trichuris trichiura]|uniref:KH 1 domain containing protein n=1 Tax=Trichuris trichiura TaxID=36087 RepID=A0A077ZGV0_TRITR|nr:KH 1 domain containing protein [Trichuris trichiura]
MIFAEDRLQIEQVDHLIDRVSSFDLSQSSNQVKKECIGLLVCKVDHLSDQIILLPETRRTKLIKCLQETMKKHGQCFDEKIHRMTMKIIDDTLRLKASNTSSNTAESSNTLALEQVATLRTSKDPSPNEQTNQLETFSQEKQSGSRKTVCENNELSQAPCTLTNTSQTGEKDVQKRCAKEKGTIVEQRIRKEAKSTSCGNCEKESCRNFMNIGHVKKYTEPVIRRKHCSELMFATEEQQASSSKRVLQLLSDAENFKRVKAETFHVFTPEHIMFFDEESCGRFIKKTMAIPKKYFGRLIGIKGTTVQILEVLTNTVISIKQPPMSNYWRYLVAAGRCHFEVNNLISLIHFLLKYNVDFDVRTISSICLKLTWLESDRNNSSHTTSGIKDKQDRSKRKAYENRTDSDREDLETASVCHSIVEEGNGSSRNKTPNLSVSDSREKRNICSCKANKQKNSGRARLSSTNCTFLTDCLQVKNSHVGRIMGTKGSIIAIIEHFSNTVISFKDMPEKEGNRMVCIKGQRQKDIECAKEFIHLIIFHSIRFGLITDQLVSQAVNAIEKQMKSKHGVYEISFRDGCMIPDREWVPNGIKHLVRTILSKEEPGEWNCANCVQFSMPCAKVQIPKGSKRILHKNEQNQQDRNTTGSSANISQQKKDLAQSCDHNQQANLPKREDDCSSLAQENANFNAATAERLRLALQTIKATHPFSGNGCSHESTSVAQREQFLLAEMTPDAIMPFNEYWESKCSALGISMSRARDNPLP